MRTPAPPNPQLVRPAGPWLHRDLAVNGTQLHVVETGNLTSRDTIVLLHPFPQFWWAWRHVLAELADSPYRVVALDLRGFGGSDRPRTGYDLLTLARDVVGVVTAVGSERVLVAGAGLGGTVAWMVPQLASNLVSGIMPIGAPHPLEARSRGATTATRAAAAYAFFQVPVLAARSLRSGRLVRHLLGQWGGRDATRTLLEEADRYSAVLRAPFAAEAALRPLRELRRLSHAEKRVLRTAVTCPVWSIRGGADRVLRPGVYARDADHTAAALSQLVIPRAGHFLPEEAPAVLVAELQRFTAELWTR